jgi:hypothetical protein
MQTYALLVTRYEIELTSYSLEFSPGRFALIDDCEKVTLLLPSQSNYVEASMQVVLVAEF